MERFVELLSSSLRRAGWEVDILDHTSTATATKLWENIRPFVAWKIGVELNRRASEKDVVICNGYFSWNARRSRSFVVYHGTEMGRAVSTVASSNPLRNLAVRAINARLDKRAGEGRKIVAVSEATKNEIEKYYGLRVDDVIPNAVDLSVYMPSMDKDGLKNRLNLPKNKFVILYAGPNDPRKGVKFVLDEIRPRLRESQHLVITIDLSSAPKNITALGRVDFERIIQYYQACDALIMPSSYEGCSFLLAEALACGLPSVVSPTGSAKDLQIDGVLGRYVVPRMDADEYVTRLGLLQDSVDEWTRVSRASRVYAERVFALSRFQQSYVRMVEDLAK